MSSTSDFGVTFTITWRALVLATTLAVSLIRFVTGAKRHHDTRHSGNIADHAAVWAFPTAVLLIAATLGILHLQWRTPRHDPVLPTDVPSVAQR